jgi:hypothetical protein
MLNIKTNCTYLGSLGKMTTRKSRKVLALKSTLLTITISYILEQNFTNVNASNYGVIS